MDGVLKMTGKFPPIPFGEQPALDAMRAKFEGEDGQFAEDARKSEVTETFELPDDPRGIRGFFAEYDRQSIPATRNFFAKYADEYERVFNPEAVEERVARAICAELGADPDGITEPEVGGIIVPSVRWRHYLPAALAASAAFVRPSRSSAIPDSDP